MKIRAVCTILHPPDNSILVEGGEIITEEHLARFREVGADSVPVYAGSALGGLMDGNDKVFLTLVNAKWSKR